MGKTINTEPRKFISKLYVFIIQSLVFESVDTYTLFFLMKVCFNKLIYFHVVNIESPILYQSSKREDSWYFLYKHYEWHYSCIQLYKKLSSSSWRFFNSDDTFKQWRHMCIDWVGNKSLIMELCSETTLKENIACTKLQNIL